MLFFIFLYSKIFPFYSPIFLPIFRQFFANFVGFDKRDQPGSGQRPRLVGGPASGAGRGSGRAFRKRRKPGSASTDAATFGGGGSGDVDGRRRDPFHSAPHQARHFHRRERRRLTGPPFFFLLINRFSFALLINISKQLSSLHSVLKSVLVHFIFSFLTFELHIYI